MPLHVVVDAGHGGVDRGTSHGGKDEADIVLNVSHELEKMLKSDPRFQVSLTRTFDQSISLEERAELATQYGGQLFLSIHVNWSSDHKAKGGEIYFQNQLPADQESMYLAARENNKQSERREAEWPLGPIKNAEQVKPEIRNIIKDLQKTERLKLSAELAKSMVLTWQGSKRSIRHIIRQAPFYVVSEVAMPSVLVELGFLSHPEEKRLLANVAYQKKLALGLYDGLIKFKEVIDKSKSSSLD